jgi:hypothetical protein
MTRDEGIIWQFELPVLFPVLSRIIVATQYDDTHVLISNPKLRHMMVTRVPALSSVGLESATLGARYVKAQLVV